MWDKKYSWAVYGENCFGLGTRDGESDELVALFDSEEKARNYVKKSRLKSGRGFKKKSYLYGYRDAYVDFFDDPFGVFFNPRID